ncbi:MAG: hypothetical protein KJ597_07290 [Nanoarchaeota archaeon]|nr:hypothetical protein [Nanoarchaeota archaeon]
MLENEQKFITPDQRENIETFPVQREGTVESEINKSRFRYKIFLNHQHDEGYVFHLTTANLGNSITLTPQKVLDSEIDWDQIPYDYWDDAPYSPYTPRKDEKVVCFAPSPEQALLAIGKFKENIPKDKGKFYIYATNKNKVVDLKSPDTWSVRDSIETGELRTKEPTEVVFVGYIEYEAIEEDKKE